MKRFLLLPMFCFGIILSASLEAGELSVSTLWSDYVTERDAGREPVLPDFSYAGYHRGERPIPDVEGPVFDVTDFGAVPDDDQSDEDAIRQAIAAAAEAGGGVVFFPPGKFLVWTDRNQRETISIRHPNIVLRGSGSRRGGTVIHQIHDSLPMEVDPETGYPPAVSGKPLFLFEPSESPAPRRLTDITADSVRMTDSVQVADAGKLHPGQWVRLRFGNNKAASYLLDPYEPLPEWTRILRQSPIIDEAHQILEVTGNTVRFTTPIQLEVRVGYEPFLQEETVIEEVGVEDIAFMGGWIGYFEHHRNALDDHSWQPLRLTNVANSWVRRCTFINVSLAVGLNRVSQTTALHLTLAGAQGHVGVSPRGGYGVLAGLVEDLANTAHGPTTGYHGISTVFWRWNMSPGQKIDMHTGRPYATLLDRIDGGSMMGSGGPVVGFPNHTRWLVAWNFSHDSDETAYSFWGNRPWFVKPLLAGLHGKPVVIDTETVKVNESQGRPVQPESLYEAQLEHRLGTVPAWIDEAKKEWEILRRQPLPDHLHPERLPETESAHQHIERFPVAPLLDHVALLPLRVRGPISGHSAETADGTGEIETDWTQLRQNLYSLMICAHDLRPREIRLRASRNDRDEIVFEVEPVAGRRPETGRREPDLRLAKELAQLLGGKVTVHEPDSRTIFRLTFPAER